MWREAFQDKVLREVQYLMGFPFHYLPHGDGLARRVMAGKVASFFKSFAESLRRDGQGLALIAGEMLGRSERSIRLQVERVLVQPADFLPLRLPFIALVVTGPDDFLSPAPCLRRFGLAPIVGGYIDATAGNRRTYQLDEAPGGVACCMVSGLRLRSVSVQVPNLSKCCDSDI